MKKNTNRRAQTAKPLAGSRNERYSQDMQELRRSNAATPHKMATAYQRKPKHPKKGWE